MNKDSEENESNAQLQFKKDQRDRVLSAQKRKKKANFLVRDPEYAKWTNTFSRKTILWDDVEDCFHYKMDP